jgi:hypothetical protein
MDRPLFLHFTAYLMSINAEVWYQMTEALIIWKAITRQIWRNLSWLWSSIHLEELKKITTFYYESLASAEVLIGLPPEYSTAVLPFQTEGKGKTCRKICNRSSCSQTRHLSQHLTLGPPGLHIQFSTPSSPKHIIFRSWSYRVLCCRLFWLYANISEEHVASIFMADSQNITWHKTQQTNIYIHITMKT